MRSEGGDLIVWEPQVHSGTRPRSRRVKRVSDMREERASSRGFCDDEEEEEEEDVGLGLGGLEWFRSRARRLSRVCKAIHGAEERI